MQQTLIPMMFFAALLLCWWHAWLQTPWPRSKTCSFVINLPHDGQRLRRFKRLYREGDFADVPLTVVEGVNGKNVRWEDYVAPDALDKLKKMVTSGYREDHPDLTPGAVGCYLSHMRVFELVASCGHPYAYVFEDDADILPGARAAFDRALSRIPPDWDIVLLGHLARGVEYCEGVVEADFFLLNHAYALSARAARRLLTLGMLPMKKQVDWALSDMIEEYGLKIYALEPKMAMQNYKFQTNIQSPLKDD